MRQADKEIIFDPRINIEIPCISKGDPAPRYTWTKDKRIYDPSSQKFFDDQNRLLLKPAKFLAYGQIFFSDVFSL